MKRFTDWLVYVAIRVLICVVQAIPLRTCQRFSNLLAIVLNDWLGVRRDVVEDNLLHAFPELDAVKRRDLSRRMWSHLLLLMCEIAHAPRKVHETNWRQHVQLLNPRPMVKFLLSPRPLVTVTGHFGNFEMCGYLAGLLGFPTYTIARPLDNTLLHEFLIRFRATTGQFILPNQGSAEAAQHVVDSGETLAILGDHFGGQKGCWVEFFNRPASCHKSIALFALANKVPLMVSYARRLDEPLKFEFGMAEVADPADSDFQLNGVPEMTQWYNRHLEDAVRQTPEQYWWLHRRWKERRVSRKKRTAA
jgi:KDO2-lipid IV(A) lauroyltransferase